MKIITDQFFFSIDRLFLRIGNWFGVGRPSADYRPTVGQLLFVKLSLKPGQLSTERPAIVGLVTADDLYYWLIVDLNSNYFILSREHSNMYALINP